jgi:hypothetical protein
MDLGRCEVGECAAGAAVTHLDHGVCKEHFNQLTAEDAAPGALTKALGIEAPTTLPMEEIMTVPTAGTRRGKRTSSEKAPAKKGKESRPKKEKASGDSDVVFAFRLSEADRARIHEASGPGGATRFVRAAALAAANADAKAFEELVAQARANLK